MWKSVGKTPKTVDNFMFIGEYRHTIDTKKRLALPSKFRKNLGRSIIITKGLENCLAVYPEKEWKIMSGKLGKLPTGQMESRGFARIMLSGAMSVSIDRLGRILVPDYLKSYAGFEKNVVICGLYNRLELWDSKRWDNYRKETEEKFADIASKLGDAGI